MKIFCPLCEWRPRPIDRWVCSPGCGTWWNTFETRARCPGCGKQWRETDCHACHRWSLHDDWYHEEEPDQETVDESAAELVGAGEPGG
jgi:hypothetical protein